MTQIVPALPSPSSTTMVRVLGWIYPLLLADIATELLQDSRWAQSHGLTGHPALVFSALACGGCLYWIGRLRAFRKRRARWVAAPRETFESWSRRREALGLYVAVPAGVALGLTASLVHVPASLAVTLFIFLGAMDGLAYWDHARRVECMGLSGRQGAGPGEPPALG